MNEKTSPNPSQPSNTSQEQQDNPPEQDRPSEETRINEVTNLNYVGGTVLGSMESTPRFVDEAGDRLDYLYRDEPEEEGYISSPENS